MQNWRENNWNPETSGCKIIKHIHQTAIALENLWLAEKKAKEHKSSDGTEKDAVQVRVLYGNGNTFNHFLIE